MQNIVNLLTLWYETYSKWGILLTSHQSSCDESSINGIWGITGRLFTTFLIKCYNALRPFCATLFNLPRQLSVLYSLIVSFHCPCHISATFDVICDKSIIRIWRCMWMPRDIRVFSLKCRTTKNNEVTVSVVTHTHWPDTHWYVSNRTKQNDIGFTDVLMTNLYTVYVYRP